MPQRLLASASGDRTVKLWDVRSGLKRATLNCHILWINTIAFSPDGSTLVGFLSLRDLLHQKLDETVGEAESLRAYIQTGAS